MMWHLIAAGVLGLLIGAVAGAWQGMRYQRKKNQGEAMAQKK